MNRSDIRILLIKIEPRINRMIATHQVYPFHQDNF